MLANRPRDTKPELAVRRRLHARGLRYLVDKAPIASMRSRADLVFRGARIAVFIDGCYWHSCPEHRTVPKSNPEYWSAKLAANRDRDERVVLELREVGWLALRFWEHEDPDAVADAVERRVRERSASHHLG
jgi:DNA mismatch endonuclease (patch repair protein)